MPEETFMSGALFDTRSEEEKSEDYLFRETVVSINPVNWVEKPPSEWRKFPIFNQNGSGSCVAQTLAKLLGVLYWLRNQYYVHFSATHIYQRRSNKPGGGMAGVDAFQIAQKGTTLEELVPSQGMTDAQMDAVEIPQYKQDVGSVFKIPNYLTVPIKDIDTIASIIQTTGKAVMVWFYFEYQEWTDVPQIINTNLDLYAQATCRHSVAAVDFTLYQGKKALIIDESWGKGITQFQSQRVITEDFFKVRNWFAAYPINFQFFDQTQPQPQPQPVDPKPRHHFDHVLVFGQTDDADVKSLQNILKYEGLFPKNIASTAYYGAITTKGVYDFQVKHKVASLAELNSLKGRRAGAKTIAMLNQLYG